MTGHSEHEFVAIFVVLLFYISLSLQCIMYLCGRIYLKVKAYLREIKMKYCAKFIESLHSQ